MSAQKNVGASVRARLLNRAKESGSDYGLILTKYALERLLYRLSVSQWGDAFLLKGGDTQGGQLRWSSSDPARNSGRGS